MSEIILVLVIIALLTHIGISTYIISKEREKTLKIIVAKNLQEVTENEVMEKVEPNKETPVIPSEFKEVSPDDEIAFDSLIEKEIEVNPKDN